MWATLVVRRLVQTGASNPVVVMLSASGELRKDADIAPNHFKEEEV
jgi:hypothetical protein